MSMIIDERIMENAKGKARGLKFESGTMNTFYTVETEAAIYAHLASEFPIHEKEGYHVVWRAPFNPRRLTEEYGIDPKRITWLTTFEAPAIEESQDYKPVHPSDLAKLNTRICTNQSTIKPEIKHLHFGRGATIDLSLYNSFDSLLRFLSLLGDRAEVDGCVITADIPRKAFGEQNYAKLMRDCKFIEMDAAEKA